MSQSQLYTTISYLIDFGIQTDSAEAIIQSRIRNVANICATQTDTTSDSGSFFPSSLTIADRDGGHQASLAWCRIGKVGTHAWAALFLLLKGLTPDQIKVSR